MGVIVKRKALIKEFFIEIKKSFSRFISIFLIVALGVAFFAGIRSAKPDMRLSADQFYDQSNLMDIKVLSTLGLTKDDVEALSKVEGVKEVQPAYSADVLCATPDDELVVKMMSVPENVNKVLMKSGRMPENNSECIVDEAFLLNTGYTLGDKVKLQSGTDDPLPDTLKYNEYTIVGSCITSYYLSVNKGSSAIGNGDINSFIMVEEDAFNIEAYTEIYVTVDQAIQLLSYSEKYDDHVSDVVDRIKNQLKESREKARYNEIVLEANEEIADAKVELADAKEEAEQELADGKKKIDDAGKKLTDGKDEISKNEKKLEDGKQEIADGKQKIADAWKTLSEKDTQLSEAKEKMEDGEAQLLAGKKEYNKNKKAYDDGVAKIAEANKQLETQEQALIAGEKQLEQAKLTLAEQEQNPTLPADTIAAMKATIAAKEIELTTGKTQLAAAKTELDKQNTALLEGKPALLAAKKQLSEAEKKLKTSKETLTSGEQKLAKGKAELQNKEAELDKAEQDIKDGEKELKKAKKKIADGEEKLADATKDYEEGKAEADTKIADAEEEIADGEQKIADIKKAKWYVLDRNSLQTYVEFGQDSDRIGAIGEVFPIIFFLVAALVSLTTMTRMVEEQRTQIGTLKALGYSKGSIAIKYLGYAFLATLGGSLFGGIIGCMILPRIIITAYQIMYKNLPVVVTPVNQYYVTMAAFIAIACVLTATTSACFKELATSPAELMRPAAPKLGKRVFLERIPFIWNRMNFTMKSAVRNLFRYKKRFFMTIFGIGGCMALMLVGYGVKDSIASITDLQYNQIHIFDGTIQINEDASDSEVDELVKTLDQDNRIKDYKYQYQSYVDAASSKKEVTAAITVLEDVKNINQFIHFKNRLTKENYILGEDGVMITEKLAKLLKLKVGDKISIKNGDTKRVEAPITAITENYVQHYIYMTQSFYKELYGEKVDYNQIIFIDNDLSVAQQNQLEEDLLINNSISSISVSSDVKGSFGDMLGSLDIVILVLIISAGGLAFVVLYNLNNISINERKRELATIKVLGFYDIEVSEYIYRENVVLTFLGIIVGVFLGLFLHHYVIVTCEVDMIMFGRIIEIKSYIYSIMLTFLFALLINLSMHFKLKKVDMAASLKSIE